MGADTTERLGRGTIVVDDERCTGCGLCIPVCPPEVIGLADRINSQGFHVVELVAPGCLPCNACAVVCPEVAISVFRLEGEEEVQTEYERFGA